MEFKRFISDKVIARLHQLPAVALLGPRQVGKTTLARQLQREIPKDSIYLDLESPEDLRKLDDAEGYLLQRSGALVVIDEVQRMPELFPVLRSVIDKHRVASRFLLLGSASPELLAKSSETLAGRISYIEISPFVYPEVKDVFTYQDLWVRGGFPAMLTAPGDEISYEDRLDFLQTYLERELPLLGLSASPVLLRNLLRMVASINGNLINYSDFSKSLGVDLNTVKRYLDYFENSFLIRRLTPYFANVSKRLVKSPKIYIRDSGLLHAVAGVENLEMLEGYIGKGNSWEGFVIQQIVAQLRTGVNPYFYRTQDGSELDLVLVKGLKPTIGIEIKYSNSPKLTKGTTIASQDLGNIPVITVTPSISEDYKQSKLITVTSFTRLFDMLEQHNLV